MNKLDLPLGSAEPLWDLNQSLPQRFVSVVEAFPDNLAIVDREISLTYPEFNNQANRLAHEVLQTMQGVEGRVGLVLNNGVHQYVAAMACAKVGRCYVPLDPVQPIERLREYIERTGIKCLITDNRYEAIAQDLSAGSLPILSAELVTLKGDIDNPLVEIEPEAEAYIIMTSGSTGAPKGVLHGHLGTLHNIMVSSREFGLTSNDSLLTMSTPAVYGAQRNIYLGLLTGATTHYIPVREVGFAGVGKYIEEHKIDSFTSVLTVFRRILESLTGEEDLSSLKFVTCGGEPLYWTDIRRAFKHLPPTCRVRNSLTMSESNIITNAWYGPEVPSSGERVPLGTATQDKVVELRKKDGTPAGPGEVGEVFVTSKYIALGYLNAPEEVANRFQKNADGTRTFATGDLARIDENGDMIIVGRSDHQVKLRGYRVDLSEVEATILNHPNVAEAVIKVHQVEGKPDQLVAYVRMNNQGNFSVRALRDFCGQKLSSYMIPSHFVPVQQIPQTASGKVHRQALTLPDEVAREGLEDYVPPRNELDEWLVDVWESWIGVKGVGIDDDFFEVGGDSLSATQLIMQIDEVYETPIDAEAILNTCNTIRKMSDYLAAGQVAAASDAAKPAIQRDINFVDGDAEFEQTNRPELYRLDRATGLRIGKPNAEMGSIRLNNLGFRGPDLDEVKSKDCLRIAFLGASGVFDPRASSNEHTWPHLMVEGLTQKFPGRKFDYINAGLPGYSTVRSQKLFETFVEPLAPDVVIIQTGDMNRDANYLARQQGIFDGVAYRPSKLARKFKLAMLLEKNLMLAHRRICALLPWGRLSFGDDIANDYEARLKGLIETCKAKGRTVLVLECRRLRKSQSLWQQLGSLSSYCLYMPYMSLSGFLRAQDLYSSARQRAANATGCDIYDATDDMPPDNIHFADTSHFRDPGSRRFAGLVSAYLAEMPEFREKLG